MAFRRSALVALALTGSIVLAGCGNAETDPANIEGVEWTLAEFQEGNAADPLVDTVMTLKDGRVTGDGGVNRLSGHYEATDDGKITFERIATTKKAGPQEAMDQEGRFVDSLNNAASFEYDKGDKNKPAELELKNIKGATLMVLVADK